MMEYPLTLTKRIGKMNARLHFDVKDATGKQVMRIEVDSRKLNQNVTIPANDASPIFDLQIQFHRKTGRQLSVRLPDGRTVGEAVLRGKGLMAGEVVLHDATGAQIGTIASGDSWKTGASVGFMTLFSGLLPLFARNKAMIPTYRVTLHGREALKLTPNNRGISTGEARRVIEKVGDVKPEDEPLVLGGLFLIAPLLT
ncbi:MAG: hypothetical protein GYB66_09845 [Chloroflexi bacterium]|nr:hypothetical protein [Chloroflexota bacterium]